MLVVLFFKIYRILWYGEYNRAHSTLIRVQSLSNKKCNQYLQSLVFTCDATIATWMFTTLLRQKAMLYRYHLGMFWYVTTATDTIVFFAFLISIKPRMAMHACQIGHTETPPLIWDQLWIIRKRWLIYFIFYLVLLRIKKEDEAYINFTRHSSWSHADECMVRSQIYTW